MQSHSISSRYCSMKRVVRVGMCEEEEGHRRQAAPVVDLTYYLLPTILLLINIYNLLPFKPLFATGIHAWAPCTFWRSCSQIPIHSWHTISWCGSAAERTKLAPRRVYCARVE